MKRGAIRPRRVVFRALMIKLGVIPPDTEFTRRAEAYAKESARIANA